MAEYINRDLIVKNSMLHTWKKADLLRAIKEAPTADVVEVKHGYWKWEKKIEPQAQNRLYCSACDNECLGKNNYYVKTEYCPYCFARMDSTPKERGGEK